MPIDQRGRLAAQPFEPRVAGDTVQVYFRGRLVRTLTGPAAAKVQAALDAGDDVQLLLARLTGNFKRGNER